MFFQTPVLAFLPDVGGPEMLLVFVLILVLFGGKRMPDLARGLGKSLRDFKRAREGVEDQIKRALEEEPTTVKRLKKLRKPEAATTTPDDTAVYDEAAKAAGAATTAAAGSDPTDDSDPSYAGTSDEPENTNTPGHDSSQDYVDPYEDEYIGGTAKSDAGAHGFQDEVAGTASGKEAASEESPPSQDTGADQPEKKKGESDASATDGGGI